MKPLLLLALVAATRLTNVVDSYPCPSPDGRTIVFQSNRTGRWQLFLAAADGKDVQQLADIPGEALNPKFSPDGAEIAFAHNVEGIQRIAVISADGTHLRDLTHGTAEDDDSHPNWTADGKRVTFNSSRLNHAQAEVFSMDLSGVDVRQHSHCNAVCTYASFSPDGTKLLYRKVTDTPGFNWDLSTSPRNSEIFVADADGSHEVNLSHNAAFDGWPAWSPDSRQIVFASNRGGPANVGQLYLVNADGSGLRQLTGGDWSHAQPIFARDGKTIFAYELQEGDDYEHGGIVAVRP
jgi:TolB protein